MKRIANEKIKSIGKIRTIPQ